MIVTDIQTISKSKYRIFLDDEFAFVLYKGDLSHYKLKTGIEITENQYLEILEQVVLKRAKLRALHLLTDMGRSEKQLRQKLQQTEYPEKVIEAAISYVKSFGYLNDRQYAESFIISHKDKYSKRELSLKLREKGIQSQDIDLALEEAYGDSASEEENTIRQILEKKHWMERLQDPKEKQKVVAYFVRKGFSYTSICNVLQVSLSDA